MAGSSSSCATACDDGSYCDNGACRSRLAEFPVPSRGQARMITAGPDGNIRNIWFTEPGAGKVGRFVVP